MQPEPIETLTPAQKLAGGFLLTDVDVAALLGAGLQTVRNWRAAGKGVPYVKLAGRMVRYTPEAVQAFIDDGKVRVA